MNRKHSEFAYLVNILDASEDVKIKTAANSTQYMYSKSFNDQKEQHLRPET
jgi:hypothetical protein